MKFAAAFTVLASITAALAQVRIETPSVVACANARLTVSGGTPPYIVTVNPGGQPSADPLEQLGVYNSTSGITWFVAQPAGTSVFLRVRDSTGDVGESGTFTIGAGVTTGCSPSTYPGIGGGGSVTAPTTGAAPTTTDTPATTTTPGETTDGTTPTTAPTTRNTGTATNTNTSGGSQTTTGADSAGIMQTVQNTILVGGLAAAVMAVLA